MTRLTKTFIVSFLKSPVFITFCLSLLILTFNILFIAKYRPFNSDDVYWQIAVKTWKPFSGDTFYFGAPDVFVILGPFFTVLEGLFDHSRRLLALEALILIAGSFSLFYWSSLYILKKSRITLSYKVLLPFVWLASFGYPTVSWYLNSNWRSFEIGFSFATFVVVAAICNGDLNVKSIYFKVLGVSTVLVTALLIYSDPYYMYFTIAPLLLAAVMFQWFGKIKKSQAVLLYSGLVSSWLVSKLFSLIFTAAGIRVSIGAPSTFVTFESIIDNIEASFHAMFHIFGADFLGNDIISKGTLFTVVNALLLCAILVVIITYKKYLRPNILKREGINKLWPVILVIVMSMIFAVNTFSTLVGMAHYRFYMMFTYIAVTILSIALGRMKNKKLTTFLIALLLLAIPLNIVQVIQKNWLEPNTEMSSNLGNSLNYELVDAAKAHNLTKGYANFWQANINTYLSGDMVTFLPSLCDGNGVTAKFKWLTTEGQFNKKASSSFYFLSAYNNAPVTCSASDLIKQLGEPRQTLVLRSGTLYIFDYDISDKLL